MLALGLAASAAAAPGQIGYDGCLADDAAQLCADLPGAPLDGAIGVAVSPDGRSVYTAAQDAAAVAWFARTSAPGGLALGGCLAGAAAPPCRPIPRAPLVRASGVAVSPDGRSVYVVAASTGAIAQFRRKGPRKPLTYDGCLADDSAQGCQDLPGSPLGNAFGVAVSPDGRSVYVVSAIGNSIARFSRSRSTGRLAYSGCLADDAAEFCEDLPGAPLTGATGVAVSPDGRSVYVAATRSNAVARFARHAPDGRITYAGCLADDATDLCRALPGSPLRGAAGVAVSPDGRSVYVASAGSNAVARFLRAPAGGLTYAGCLANHAAPRCGDLPGAPLGGATGIVVSPDGLSVYVAASGSNAVSHFAREGVKGRLTFDGCLANTATRLCGDLPGSPLSGAIGVAVSPDGGSVYVTATGADGISRFSRSLGPAPPPGSVITPGPPAAG